MFDLQRYLAGDGVSLAPTAASASVVVLCLQVARNETLPSGPHARGVRAGLKQGDTLFILQIELASQRTVFCRTTPNLFAALVRAPTSKSLTSHAPIVA